MLQRKKKPGMGVACDDNTDGSAARSGFMHMRPTTGLEDEAYRIVIHFALFSHRVIHSFCNDRRYTIDHKNGMPRAESRAKI